jgi:two-component system, NtrC family, sensor kinase
MTHSLKTRIFVAFALVIILISAPIALIGYFTVRLEIIEQAQLRVVDDLQAARSVYQREIDRIGSYLKFYDLGVNEAEIRSVAGIEYLRLVPAAEIEKCPSEIARAAYRRAAGLGGSRIVAPEELVELTGTQREITVLPTEHAYQSDMEVLRSALAKEYALPIYAEDGSIEAVVYAGRIVNRNYEIVDRIRRLIYGQALYRGKPSGTVTIFQDGIRVATNVLDKQGRRAIGTQVSREVYERVVSKGESWLDRAFVVTDWYMTGYEPIRSVSGEVIGIMYVGVLEAPFTDAIRRLLMAFAAIVAVVSLLGMILAFVLASRITRPVGDVLAATKSIAEGGLGYQVRSSTGIDEFDGLIAGFNTMSTEIHQRDESLRVSNTKLEDSNRNYVELISFVSHELKGILASAIMNVYSVRDGILGLVNFKQRKAIDSVARNLDYLDATVKKFLNLGRIEQDRLNISKSEIDLAEDVFVPAVEGLLPLAKRREIRVENQIAPSTLLQADADMLKVVANNLISNAIKYGVDGGVIRIAARELGSAWEVEVYNDSTPIDAGQIPQLFKKFSRLDNEQTRTQKGTGLGLFITRQIVEKHGGTIRVEPRENGNSFIFEIEKGE